MGTKLFDILKDLEGLKIDEEKDINFLLLGTSGVGKSTFVNALSNYLSYKSLKNAEKQKLMVLVPAQINITDADLTSHSFNSYEFHDGNEGLEVGASATQNVKTYVFPIGSGKTRLRIIDSPGVGDCRGADQDNINCERILSYLTSIEKLHAICLLFPTNISRDNPFVNYCFKEILSRLDRTASRNLVFLITNARAAHFTPGDTHSTLRKILSDIESQQPGLTIPFDNKNIFCFENDCFKYLAARKKGITFTDDQKSLYKESWKYSSQECWRLVRYIVGDQNNKPLPPHDIRNTVSINEARRIINYTSKPLADISELIQDNINILERHRFNLQKESTNVDEMRKQLYIPVINLKVTAVTQPVTVCCSKKCAEIYHVGSVCKSHYKQRCHDPCYLTGVQKDIIGDPQLASCDIMNNKRCTKCLCDFSTHMHIYYLTDLIEDNIEDGVMRHNLRTREEVVERIKKYIDNIEERKKQYEQERDDIIKYTAQFAHFLQTNAMAPINDSYESYVKYTIEREQSLGQYTNNENVKNLQYMLNQYKESKRTFEAALKLQEKLGKEIDIGLGVTAEKIFLTVNKLYSLPYTGKKIKELVESQNNARAREHNKTTEYVHASPANVFADIGEKKIAKEKFNYQRSDSRVDEDKGKQHFNRENSASRSDRRDQGFKSERQYEDQRHTRIQSSSRNDRRKQDSNLARQSGNQRYSRGQSPPKNDGRDRHFRSENRFQNRGTDRRYQGSKFDRPQDNQHAAGYTSRPTNQNTRDSNPNIAPPPYSAVINQNDAYMNNPQMHPPAMTHSIHHGPASCHRDCGAAHVEVSVFQNTHPTCGNPTCRDLMCVPTHHPNPNPGYQQTTYQDPGTCGRQYIPPHHQSFPQTVAPGLHQYAPSGGYQQSAPYHGNHHEAAHSGFYNQQTRSQHEQSNRGGFYHRNRNNQRGFNNRRGHGDYRGHSEHRRRTGSCGHLDTRNKFKGSNRNSKHKPEKPEKESDTESSSSSSSSSDSDSD